MTLSSDHITPESENVEPENVLRGIKARLLDNIRGPQYNSRLPENPACQTIVADSQEAFMQANITALELGEERQKNVEKISPYITEAATILYRAAEEHPKEMLEMYNWVCKGSSSNQEERERVQKLADQLFDQSLSEEYLNPEREERELFSPSSPNLSRRQFIKRVCGGAAAIAAAGTTASAVEVGKELLGKKQPNGEKIVRYGAIAGVGGAATLGMGLVTFMLHDEERSDATKADVMARENRENSLDSVKERCVDAIVAQAALRLYQLKEEKKQTRGQSRGLI